MAIKAGRVGVNRADVDELGHVTVGGLTPEERAKLDNALVAPEPTVADAGKVLTVNSSGELEWHEKGGGGGDVVKFSVADIDTLHNVYINTSGKITSGNTTPMYGVDLTEYITETGTYCIALDGTVSGTIRYGWTDVFELNGTVNSVASIETDFGRLKQITFDALHPIFVIGVSSSSANPLGINSVSNIYLIKL